MNIHIDVYDMAAVKYSISWTLGVNQTGTSN